MRQGNLQNQILRTQILELSDMEFKITLVDMLRPPVEKADSMHDQVGYFIREIDMIRKSNENSRNEKHSNRDKKCL